MRKGLGWCHRGLQLVARASGEGGGTPPLPLLCQLAAAGVQPVGWRLTVVAPAGVADSFLVEQCSYAGRQNIYITK